MNYSILEYLHAWYSGQDFNSQDTLWGFKIFWIGRLGQILQFVSALTIIAEIVGKQKMQQTIEAMESKINLKQLGITIFIIVLYLYIFVIKSLRIAKESDEQKAVRDFFAENQKNKFSIRDKIKIWRSNNSNEYQNFIEHKKREPIVGGVLLIISIALILYDLIQFSIQIFKDNSFFPELKQSSFLEIAFDIFIRFVGVIFYLLMTFFIASPITAIILCIGWFMFLAILEYIYFKPAIFYLKFSQKENIFKSFGLILLFIGSLLSFLFS